MIFRENVYAPAGFERFWRIQYEPIRLPKIIQYDIVYFRGTSEEFLEILVIRAIVPWQVVLLFP